MARSTQFKDGYRCASKDAVEWLHARAALMNDPHAQQILNSAAFNLGTDCALNGGKIPTGHKAGELRDD